MSDAGRRLGSALMEGPTVQCNAHMQGLVEASTLREAADKARDEALEFFGDIPFSLDISYTQHDPLVAWSARTL